jgi:hypothetical protein
MNDDGIKQLAIAVLQQAIADLNCRSEADRRSAEAFVGREDFDSWCILAGLNPDAAHERLRRRQPEAA